MEGKKLFKISSALKNIIGKDLITDDFIAVFELVKNSFDANATKVDVTFEGLGTAEEKLIIKDNGSGMSPHDLENKWLFVAYSNKKNSPRDYRDNLANKRISAGAKGIGRFSCDKLGSHLNIYTKPIGQDIINKLEVDWEKFELDPLEEFINIDVGFEQLKENKYSLKHGTVLEITNLRENWDREKLLRLKRSLEKLINPSQNNDSENFQIFLNVPSELNTDATIPPEEKWKIVNGLVTNFLFENLGLKTVTLRVECIEGGRFILSRLEDRGVLIYEIKERNNLTYEGKYLDNITINLFSLNTNAKTFFTKYMGIRATLYGSVLLYKNGFRVHPFGEVGDDTFGLDSRKTQGTMRFMGTRELIGRIEIGDNSDFQEVTSRDGGLIKNAAYYALKEMFMEYALKRLEKYAVDILKFGNFPDSFEEQYESQANIRSSIVSLVDSITQSSSIVDVKYDPQVVNILSELSEKSLNSLLKNFERIALDSRNDVLINEANKARERLNQLNKAKAEAELEADKEREARKKAEAQARLEAERARKAEYDAALAKEEATEAGTQNLFLQSVVSHDLTNVISLHHHIGIAANTIENYVGIVSKKIKSGQAITTDYFLQVLNDISLQARKIHTTTNFATKANFSLDAVKISGDICEYISEYIGNVCTGIYRNIIDKEPIKFVWINKQNIKFHTKYKPMELAIILDNLIVNSRKAKAKTIKIEVIREIEEKLQIEFSDDGIGIPENKIDKIFDLGFTTTDGSGLGLFQTKKIISELKGNIIAVGNLKVGAKFLLEFSK